MEHEERARRILQVCNAGIKRTNYESAAQARGTQQSSDQQVTNEQLYQEMQNYQEDEESGEEEEVAPAVSALEVWRQKSSDPTFIEVPALRAGVLCTFFNVSVVYMEFNSMNIGICRCYELYL